MHLRFLRLAFFSSAFILLLACTTITSLTPFPLDYQYKLPLATKEGRFLSLSTTQDRLLMLDFFTTWSQASLLAIPGYSTLYQKYEKHGLSIVGVAMDDLGLLVVKPFVEGMNISYPVVLATEDIKKGESLFGKIDVIPTLMLIDTNGNLLHVIFGSVKYSELEKLIRRLLQLN